MKAQKTYNIQYNIGSVRYVVNYHDGIKTYKDGSPFYDLATFSNKKKMNDFIRHLKAEGYTEESFLFTPCKKEEGPLILTDYQKYAFADYKSEIDAMNGYRLGEIVYDQCGQVGMILAFYPGDEVRLNSNGVCDIDQLKKCPRNIAENELASMIILRPMK